MYGCNQKKMYSNQNSCNNNGSAKYYESHGTICGDDHKIKNENYYDNYYTKYNNYYVKDYNYVTDHITEYNVYHYDNETIYNGTINHGTTNIAGNGSPGGFPSNGMNASPNSFSSNGMGGYPFGYNNGSSKSCGCKCNKCNKYC